MKINQLKAGVVLSYASMFLTNVISVVYTPIMLRMLGQSEYGLFQLAHSVISYLGLLSFGFGSAYIKFYSKLKQENDKTGIAKLNGMFMLCFLSMSLLAIIFGSILVQNIENIFSGALTESEMSKMRGLMSLMVLNIAIMFPNSVFNANITAHERYLFQRVVSLLSSVLNPLLVLLLLYAGFKAEGLVFATTVITLFKLFLDVYYCVKVLHIQFVFKGLDFSKLKEIGIFSAFIFMNMLTDMLNYSVDKFVLGMLKGTSNVAIYSIGASMNQYYISFSSAISTVFIPRVNRMVASGESNKKISELFTKVGRVQYIVIALIMSGFILFGEKLIELWAGQGYKNSFYVALIIMLPTTIPLIQNISIEIQRAKNTHMFRSITYLFIALGNLALSIPLAKLYGEVGSAIGTGIAVLLGNVIMNIYNHKHVKIDILFFWRQIGQMSIPILIAMLIGSFCTKFVTVTGYLELLIVIFIYCCIYSVVMWLLGLNEYEKKLFKAILIKK